MAEIDGQRHADELRQLREKKKEIKETLGRLRRDEAETRDVVEFMQKIDELEAVVEQAGSKVTQQTKETMMTTDDDVRKAAHENVQRVDRELDRLAKSMQTETESFEKAYSRAMDTQMGRALMRTRQEAYEISTGGATEADLDRARRG